MQNKLPRINELPLNQQVDMRAYYATAHFPARAMEMHWTDLEERFIKNPGDVYDVNAYFRRWHRQDYCISVFDGNYWFKPWLVKYGYATK